MKPIKLLLLLFAMLLMCHHTFAQKTPVGNWFIYFGNQAIDKKWNWWNEVQYRNYNFAGDLQQLLLRTGIGYNLTENNNNVLLGYAFIHSQNYVTNSDNKVSSDEHRIYQQFVTRQNYGRVFIQHRYRIEERFLNSDFKMRFRYFLSFNVPLNQKTMSPNTLYLSAYNEIFANTLNGNLANTNSLNSVFDRNRLYGAIGYVFNKNVKLEFGYLSQMLGGGSRSQFQVVVFNNLPLYSNN
jgi:hypothetical protein